MAVERASGGILMITSGGQMWRWVDAAWSAIGVEDGPEARVGASVAVDTRRSEVVYLGGTQDAAFTGDSWYWNGFTWTQAIVGPGIGARQFHGMAYDLDQGQLILFGGFTERGVVAGTVTRR
jgi:hypothetical protein